MRLIKLHPRRPLRLWNTFFRDAASVLRKNRCQEVVFADDLNVFQKFDRGVENSKSQDAMACCRSKAHQWGKVNRVTFDAGKEHIIVIHPVQGEGDPFKLLGCLVDCKLVMQQAVEKMMSQIRPKVKQFYC